MSLSTFNILQSILGVIFLVAAVGALGYLIGAFVGWRGPYRSRRLWRFSAFVMTASLAVATHQAVMWWVLLPSLGRETFEAMQAELEKSSLTQVGDTAPSFSLALEDGTTFQLDELRGKVVLLNFFASWCGPCVQELPHVQKLWEEHHTKNDFSMLVVGREETGESVAAFKAENGFSFPIAADPNRTAFSLYATQSIPRTYVISREGTIVFQAIGFTERDFIKIKKVVKSQLALAH